MLRFENRFVFRDPEYLKSEIRNVLNKRNESTKMTNQPPRPGNEHCKHQIIRHPGHPSLKRRGNFFYSTLQRTKLKLTPMPGRGTYLPHFDLWSYFLLLTLTSPCPLQRGNLGERPLQRGNLQEYFYLWSFVFGLWSFIFYLLSFVFCLPISYI